MVEFGKTNYFHAMDDTQSYQLEQMHVHDLASSSAIFGDVLDSLRAELTTGAKHVELVFTGEGKGSIGQSRTTPEMFGKLKRQEVRQLAKINDATVSTHASFGISGVGGHDQRSNRFSDTLQKQTVEELKRTIEFAADATEGGAVVVHTSEFERDVRDPRFDMFDYGEEKKNVGYLADENTGQISAIDLRREVEAPKYKKENGFYVDESGKRLKPNDYGKRVLDEKDGEIQWQTVTYKDFKKDVDTWNKKNPKDKLDPFVQFALQQNMEQLEAQRPLIEEYKERYQNQREVYRGLNKEAKEYAEKERGADKVTMQRLREQLKADDRFKGVSDEELKNNKPSKILSKLSARVQSGAEQYKQGWIAREQQIETTLKRFKDIKPVEQVGVKRSAKALAEAAMYAYKLEKEKKLDKALFIAPENMMSDWRYGAHPDELREIVVKSRKEMAKQLRRKGKSASEARKIAAEHIKATFDIGHANTWRKYFKADPKLTEAERDKEFNKWLVKEATKLTEGPEPIVGHVHISDNFGYFDEHLTVGDGNAPISEFLNSIKNKNFEGKIIVERGAQKQGESPSATLGAWARVAGSPIYRVEGGSSPRWSDIEGAGYFGTASSPFTIVGKYGASLGKDWNLWTYSEAPIE